MTTKRFVALAAASMLLLPLTTEESHAQKTSKPKATSTGTARPAAMAFAKAGESWQSIVADRKALGEVIRAGKLSEAHELVFSIRDAVVTLPYKSNPLPAAKKAALGKQVAQVAAIAENIDRYGDARNALKTKAEFARLQKALSVIEALYPANSLPASGAKPMSAADISLFLTPGGAYTKADIAANGNASAYQKYADIIPNHDAQVKSGEAVCPISETKPNPQLTWQVGGKTYRFCCPPCIAEFVQKAKTDPVSIKAPEAYVKK